MNRFQLRLLPSFVLLVCLAGLGLSQKKPLDHDVYDKWPTLRGSAISRDGQWLLYTFGPAVGDSELVIKNTSTDKTYRVPRGSNARFTFDSKFVVATVVPVKADVDKAKKEKKKPNEMPKNELATLDLSTGQVSTIPSIPSFRTAEQDTGWIAFTPDKGTPTPPPTTGGAPKPEGAKTEEPKSEKKKEHAVGKELVLMQVGTGKKVEMTDVVDYTFSKDGKTIVYTVSSKDGKEDGIYKMNLADGKKTRILVGLGNYRGTSISDKTGAIAFMSDKDDYKSATPSFTVYVLRPGASNPEVVAKEGTEGLPKGWWISNRTGLSFSENGKRVIVRTVMRPPAEQKKDETPEDEKVVVDVWNWKDPELQPMQILNAQQEINRTYSAMYDMDSRRLIQLETPELRSVTVGSRGNADIAIGSDNQPYRQLISWDTTYSDFYLINLRTGDKKKIVEKKQGFVSLSPDSKYAFWYDGDARAWFTYDVRTGKTNNVSSKIPHPMYDEEDDHPALAPSYGNAGWTKDDGAFLVYDNYDMWAVDPAGAQAPACVTDGFGRIAKIRFRNIRMDREIDYVDPAKPLLLDATNRQTMASGFYRDQLNVHMSPSKLVMEDRNLGAPTKADNADVLFLTRQSFTEFPDVWVTNPDFSTFKKVSEGNPMQAQYNWGTSEIVEWTSLNGQKLKGILRKPEDFDSMKTYPMIVYFYETLSETLHNYRSPGPSSGAGISPTFYTSRGYIVFEPDIPYKVGYPGQSSKDSVVPGVAAVLAKGYVDPKRVAIHGHSWGGYQTAYLVTQTDMFRCAISGAPVSNMTSAYGGIRWGSGMVRQMQYEKGQSRIGGSLWERPLQYIENSPIFWADKINTPLLLLHNDQDDAVPWYQSIELFTAMRRLGKPVWFINYNGEFHGIRKRHNAKDWSVRMQQFFDHYLKDGPAPVWLVEGVPATEKGKNLGLDPAKTDPAKKGGN